MTTYEKNAERGYLNKRNGDAFEFKVMRGQKKPRNTLFSIRSAGSHGVIDIVTMKKDRVICIACKNNGYISPKERNDIAKFIDASPDFVQVELHYYKTPRKMARVILKKAII